jgi:hypothetical protein
MAFDVNQFLSNLKTYGYSSSNKFDILISLPNILGNQTITNGNLAGLPQILQMRAQSVTSPAIGLQSTESRRYGMGPIIKQPYNAVFGNLEMSFLTDKYGLIYQFFYEWINSIYNFAEIYNNSQTTQNGALNYSVPNYTSAYEDDICSQVININTYDLSGNLIKIVNAYRAKPILFSETPLSWDKTDNLLKLDITFTYREFAVEFQN